MGRTKKYCQWCHKELTGRYKQAQYHKKCADLITSLKTKEIVNKKRLPHQKERTRRDIKKFGMEEELKEEVKPQVKKEIIEVLSDDRLYGDDETRTSYVNYDYFDELKRKNNKRQFADIIEKIKKKRTNVEASS